MGQVIALCTSDETDDNGYNKSTVEKVRSLKMMKPSIIFSFFFVFRFLVKNRSITYLPSFRNFQFKSLL